MTSGEWISLATLAAVLLTAVMDRNKKRFENLERALMDRIKEIHDEITKRQDRQDEDTDKLKIITSKLQTEVAVIKRTCKLIHNTPDSTDPTDAPHISQLKRVVNHG